MHCFIQLRTFKFILLLTVTKGKKTTLKEAFNSLENGFINAGSTGGARELLKGSSSK